MDKATILDRIAQGRTDLVFDLLALPDWRTALNEGQIKALQWFVYYNDTTALKAILAAGGDLSSIDLNTELGHACFFGHWKVADFLLKHGANASHANADTGETMLHNALCKAGRPYFIYVLRLLLAHGADPNAHTIPGQESGGFMRDVRTKGETPLHRAAAFGDAAMIQLLLDHGADAAAQDASGDTPIAWASWHLRPGAILKLLAHGQHRISDNHVATITSDHGAGWGNGMERKFVGEYLPESLP
jgi:ankyrin repeat protein